MKLPYHDFNNIVANFGVPSFFGTLLLLDTSIPSSNNDEDQQNSVDDIPPLISVTERPSPVLGPSHTSLLERQVDDGDGGGGGGTREAGVFYDHPPLISVVEYQSRGLRHVHCIVVDELPIQTSLGLRAVDYILKYVLKAGAGRKDLPPPLISIVEEMNRGLRP